MTEAPHDPPHDPLILTVTLDPASQARFDRLRERYFPPSLNYLAAHVTLFHHLPGEHRASIQSRLTDMVRSQAPCPFSVTGLRFLGRGTACALEMPAVTVLRQRLASAWAPWLTAQDRQGWRPHVTVQNKVAPAEARRVLAELQAGFCPFEGQVTGFHLWTYLGGPWESLGAQAFLGGAS